MISLSDFEEDGEEEDDDNDPESNAYNKMLMVERIIHSQLVGLGGIGSTTARRVSKSTKPYVSCQKVIDIAQGCDDFVVKVETPISQSTISFK